MKDQRFIELLNLYIDRQITAEETTELEAEMQQNPSRQAVYQQYCRIHSATKLVYDSFRANAAEMPAGQQINRAGVVELFETKRRRSQFTYYVGGLAAAACLALVFVRYNPEPLSSEATTITQVSAQPSLPLMSEPVAIPTAPLLARDPSINLVSLRNAPEHTPDYSAMLVALREQDEERAFASGQLQINRSQSLFDDGVFDAQRNKPVQNPRVFRSRLTPAQQAEFTAFQFQR